MQHSICEGVFLCEVYVKVALALLRKPFNLLFSAVPHISACISTEKGLAITEVLKNYWRKESMTFSGENTSLFFALQKLPNESIVCFNLTVSWNNRVITTYAPMHLVPFLCKNSAGHFCLNGQFFMWKESSDNVLLNKTGLFHDSLHLFLSLCVSQLLSAPYQGRMHNGGCAKP